MPPPLLHPLLSVCARYSYLQIKNKNVYVYLRVLPCVAVCCSLLQCVAVCAHRSRIKLSMCMCVGAHSSVYERVRAKGRERTRKMNETDFVPLHMRQDSFTRVWHDSCIYMCVTQVICMCVACLIYMCVTWFCVAWPMQVFDLSVPMGWLRLLGSLKL